MLEFVENRILQGECTEVLETFPDNSIDLIFADPPYFMQTSGQLIRADGDGFSGVIDEWDKFEDFAHYDSFCEKWLTQCQRVLKPTGSIWVIGSFQNIYRIGYIMQNLGFWILNDVIWHKANPVPNFAGTRFCNAHETLLWCGKNKKAKPCFNYKTMKHLNNDKQDKSVWQIPLCTGNERLKTIDGKKAHNTQKPEKLLYKVILSSTKPNDIVLDPFFGTGTTGAVAKQLQRRFIGIERELHYIKLAEQRITNIVPLNDDYVNLTLEVKPPKVTIMQLVENGLLSIGQPFYHKDKVISYLTDKGMIDDGEDILSIHKMSAKKLGKVNFNGWDYFSIKDVNEKSISINDLRYRYQE